MNYSSLKVFWMFGFCLMLFRSNSQNALTKGDAVPDLPIKKLLNNSSPVSSFSGLGDNLTVVDFFGTWCVPCLRALPHLKDLQNELGNEVKIVLVSNETEAQLTKFIKARADFSFPVIVDEDNGWNGAFQPPALPYTVIVKNGKVLLITEAEAITTAAIRQWLKEPDAIVQTAAANNKIERPLIDMSTRQQSNNAVVRLSQDYIYAAKTGGSVTELSKKLMEYSYNDLKRLLSTDNEKKAFWINLYNGYTQATLSSAPEQYKSRNAFFKKKSIQVAGETLSLDNIEHGFLRHSKIKWSLGHLNKLVPSKKEKELRVKKLDYRIHFALNCGAKSCPPIAFYNDETLDAQLALATKAYLAGEAEYDSATNIIHLPKLMSWFRADFGGKKGMIKILRHHSIIAPDANPKIKFRDYDWTLTLNNYTKQSP